MKFRFQFTGELSKYSKYPERITLFQDKEGNWRNVKSYIENQEVIFPIVETDPKQKIVMEYDRNIYADKFEKIEVYNFYEYEIDIELLKSNPYKTMWMHYYLLSAETTDNYRDYMGEVATAVYKLPKEYQQLIPKFKFNFYGNISKTELSDELALIFPEIYDKIYNHPINIFDTFKFIFQNVINMNKLLENELKISNELINKKMQIRRNKSKN